MLGGNRVRKKGRRGGPRKRPRKKEEKQLIVARHRGGGKGSIRFQFRFWMLCSRGLIACSLSTLSTRAR